jgi:hypothetical protein
MLASVAKDNAIGRWADLQLPLDSWMKCTRALTWRGMLLRWQQQGQEDGETTPGKGRVERQRRGRRRSPRAQLPAGLHQQA